MIMFDEEDEGAEEEDPNTPHEEEEHDLWEGRKQEGHHGLTTSGVLEELHYPQKADQAEDSKPAYLDKANC